VRGRRKGIAKRLTGETGGVSRSFKKRAERSLSFRRYTRNNPWRIKMRLRGPEDEPDEEANGDPDSLVGEEDFEGFEEMSDYPDESGLDDGFEDADGEEEGDESDEEDAEEED
jgi:hypothetical protein